MKPSLLLNSLVCAALLGVAPLRALTVGEITDITPKVDESPAPVRTTAPAYPPELKKEKMAGIVAVVVVIDETGNVMACEVSKSSNEGFNQAAVEAVLKWKFAPAKLAGKAVKVKVTIPVRFEVGT